jgi:hypothetical protein
MIAALQGLVLRAGVVAAICGAFWWHGWDTRGDREAARVAEARAELRIAQARVVGLAEAQATAAAERDALRQELDHAAANDPDADRQCLGADSVRRLGAP